METLTFKDPLIIGARVRVHSSGTNAGDNGPEAWSTDAEGIYEGIRSSDWDGRPTYYFRDGIIGETPQSVFGLPVHSGVRGIWTPWAAVLCYACHGSNGPVSRDDVRSHAEAVTTADEGEDVTLCDTCRMPVVLDAKVAAEHNLATMLREKGYDASMDQTGGMCSAVGVKLSDTHEMTLVLVEESDQQRFQAFVIDSQTGEGQDGPVDDNWNGVEPWDVPALVDQALARA